jgi:N-acetyltransferase 10
VKFTPPPSLTSSEGGFVSAKESELKELKISLRDTQPIGCLVEATKTLDQAKAVLTFIEAVSEKSLRSTVRCDICFCNLH